MISLIAPRPVYVASATEDLWADPRGEFLAAAHAGPVYELLGCRGLAMDEIPDPGRANKDGTIAYHLRIGGHDVTDWDWQQWLDTADRHLQPS